MKQFIKDNKVALVSMIFSLIMFTGIFIGLFESGSFDASQLLYFTYQSNIIAASLLLMVSILEFTNKSFSARKTLMSTGLVIILITFVIYNFVLVPVTGSAIFGSYTNISMHLLAPILFATFYFVFEPKEELDLKHLIYFCIYPVLYWGVCLLAGFEPYFFMQVSVIGWGMAIVWALSLVAAFALTGFGLIKLNNKLAQK